MQNILGNKDFTPPDEMAVVKDYVDRRYNTRCRVRVDSKTVMVYLRGSSLAATVYLERQHLINNCNLKKRLVVRTISSN